MIRNNTPLQEIKIGKFPVIVKREDLCCPYPGPSFSKIRGVVAHIKNRKEKTIGVLDTLHSKAGWAVSYVCYNLSRKAVDYWPRFKADRLIAIPRPQQQIAKAKYGAILHDLPAGRSCILYHQARRHLATNYEDSYLMPNALKLPESITENAKEAELTCKKLPKEGTLVISISSGTVAAGVLMGFAAANRLKNYTVVLHMGYSRSHAEAKDYIESSSGTSFSDNMCLIDEEYGYKDEVNNKDIPFPCNPHYDAKAWVWLREHISQLESPVVFWNIGD